MPTYSKEQQLFNTDKKENIVSKVDKSGKRRFYKLITCAYCKSDHYSRKERDTKYCSSTCANRANVKEGRTFPERKTGKIVQCSQCNKKVYRQNAILMRMQRSFCSKECRDRYRTENDVPRKLISSADNKGDKNGMYKHGKHCRNGKPRKVILRRQVAERDGGNWCLLTGKPGPGLHLHRVNYGAQGGKYELGNCVLLSAEMHELVHSNKRHWQPILLSHLSGENKIINGQIQDLDAS